MQGVRQRVWQPTACIVISLPTTSQEAYQEVVVEATVLKVMHQSREVHCQLLLLGQRVTRNNSPMTHQHVSHLHD